MHVGAHESEAVASRYLAERRDVELLGSAHLAAEPQLGAAQEIAVTFAESVVDLDHDRGQRCVAAVAVPEAHRLEGEAENSRNAVQPDLASSVGDALSLQQLVDPGKAVGTTVAVVGIAKAEQTEPVARQFRRGPDAQGAQRQHQEVGRIGEAVPFWPQPGMANFTDAQERFGKGLHHAAANASVGVTSSPRQRAAIRSATSSPQARPSSWKP